jgi:hypothetical protein
MSHPVLSEPKGRYSVSEEEMREQKVRLMLEISRDEKQLAALREQAKTYGDFFIRIGMDLKSQPESLRGEGLSPAELKSIALLPVLEVAQAIRDTDFRLDELKERLRSIS